MHHSAASHLLRLVRAQVVQEGRDDRRDAQEVRVAGGGAQPREVDEAVGVQRVSCAGVQAGEVGVLVRCQKLILQRDPLQCAPPLDLRGRGAGYNASRLRLRVEPLLHAAARPCGPPHAPRA